MPKASKIEILDVKIVNTGIKTTGNASISAPNVCENRNFDLDDEVGDVNFSEGDVDGEVIRDTESVTNALKFDSTPLSAVDISSLNHLNVEHLDIMNVRHTENNVGNAHSSEMEVTFTKIPKKDHLSHPNIGEMFVANARNTDKAVAHTQVPVPTPIINLPIINPDRYKEIEKKFFDEDIPMDGSDTPLEEALVSYQQHFYAMYVKLFDRKLILFSRLNIWLRLAMKLRQCTWIE